MESVLVSRLKKKQLVYLRTTIGGADIATKPIWAVEIDTTYPWAGSYTDLHNDASAFTPTLARALNGRLKKAGMAPFEVDLAPKGHNRAIWYFQHEISKR